MPKVLVVDDSLSVRKVVEKALSGRNVEVLSAASGAEAIERIDRDRPDIVVCDVILPDKDGYQVCQYVRSHPKIGKTPVLLISGVVNSTVLARAAEVQSNDVMFKPFAADELVRRIEMLLGNSANGAPAAAPSVARPGRSPLRPRRVPRNSTAPPPGRVTSPAASPRWLAPPACASSPWPTAKASSSSAPGRRCRRSRWLGLWPPASMNPPRASAVSWPRGLCRE